MDTKITKIPFFRVSEKPGRYEARQTLTGDQIIKAARQVLRHRVTKGDFMTSPSLTKAYLVMHFAKELSEVFTVMFLNSKHQMIAIENLFHGTIGSAEVHPREVVRRCLALNAAAVIIAHYVPRYIMRVMFPVSLCADSR